MLTKQRMSVIIASFVFVAAMDISTALILLTKNPLSDVIGFMTSPMLIKCNLTTLVIFSFLAACFDGPLLKMAGKITHNIKTRYGLAYMFVLLGIILICFLPVAKDMFPPIVIVLTCLIALSMGFLGGFARGWFIDNWSNGTGAKQLA